MTAVTPILEYMLVGVDWGGTKIEAVAMNAAGHEHVRIREQTPRGDYERLDPDIIVMGGGMSNVDEVTTALPAAIASYTFSSVFETPMRAAVHGGSSGVRGAAWLWAVTP